MGKNFDEMTVEELVEYASKLEAEKEKSKEELARLQELADLGREKQVSDLVDKTKADFPEVDPSLLEEYAKRPGIGESQLRDFAKQLQKQTEVVTKKVADAKVEADAKAKEDLASSLEPTTLPGEGTPTEFDPAKIEKMSIEDYTKNRQAIMEQYGIKGLQ